MKNSYTVEKLCKLDKPFSNSIERIQLLLEVIKENYSCGIQGKYIASIRRGEISKNRGCAIALQELLDKK